MASSKCTEREPHAWHLSLVLGNREDIRDTRVKAGRARQPRDIVVCSFRLESKDCGQDL